METTVEISAPAKTNLVLEITNCLNDGFHELDTIFQWLDLKDTLAFTPAKQTTLRINSSLPSDTGLKIDSGENNLVIKALRSVEMLVQRSLPTRITLEKRIPAGGGLGGGSADAAATLLGLNQLYALQLSASQLHALALNLGADVAFGLIGGTARGQGKGGELTVLPFPQALQDYSVILIIPPFGLSTPSVYKQWDKLPKADRRPAQGCCSRFMRQALISPQDSDCSHTTLLAQLQNDLEPAANMLRPELCRLYQTMLEAGCHKALLCGSGSTVLGLVSKSEQNCQQVIERIEQALHRQATASGAGNYQILCTALSCQSRLTASQS